MRIAVTYDNGEIFQHFGHTETFKIYEIENGKIISSEVIDTDGQGHGALVEYLKQKGVETLICGCIGVGAKNMLESMCIKVYPGSSGDADAQVEAFLNNSLNYDPDTKCHHHNSEEHNCSCEKH